MVVIANGNCNAALYITNYCRWWGRIVSIYIFVVLMYLLGISAYYHNSAAALIYNGTVVCAAEEERFTRVKFDASFPANAIRFCLAKAGISLADIEAVIYYEKPLLKFERIADNFYQTAPHGYKAFIKHMPLWAKQKLFMRYLFNKELRQLLQKEQKLPAIKFSNHHLSHAASAYYCSGFNSAAIITTDGVGEWGTAAIAYGNSNSIETVAEMKYPHSVGLFYSAFTHFLGFEVNSGEYKLMGLAPYAVAESVAVDTIINKIKNELITVYDDGSVKLNLYYFDFPKGFSTINIKRVEKLLGIKARNISDEITVTHASIALAIQKITEEILLKMAATAKQLTGSAHLCLAGGVALNCVANGKLLQSKLFDDIFIQPAAGDAGGALGAALAYYYTLVDKPHVKPTPFSPYLGPEYSDTVIEQALIKHGLNYIYYANKVELNNVLAKLLAEGNILGRFAGAMEWGPRALGNRSILANTQRPDVWAKLNEKIKQRENFRPFAPAVLATDAHLYFENSHPSPYMLYTFQLKNEWRLPVSAKASSINEILLQQRSVFPAITHVDYSARVQTVDENLNPLFFELLTAYKQITGHGMLLNTSFNRNNEPIVNTPDEAIHCYLKAGLDVLAIGNYVVIS